jgi:hypothetical protein
MTFIGLLILLSVLGLLGFGVLQLTPVYLENMKVVQAMNQVRDELGDGKVDAAEIRKALRRRMVVDDLRDMDVKKDFTIKRIDVGYELKADYERRRAYIGNVYLLADFEYAVEIAR